MKNPLGYKCRYGCIRLFRSKPSRSNHYSRIHSAQHNGEKYSRAKCKFKCPTCDFKSISLDGVKKHHYSQHSERPRNQKCDSSTSVSSGP